MGNVQGVRALRIAEAWRLQVKNTVPSVDELKQLLTTKLGNYCQNSIDFCVNKETANDIRSCIKSNHKRAAMCEGHNQLLHYDLAESYMKFRNLEIAHTFFSQIPRDGDIEDSKLQMSTYDLWKGFEYHWIFFHPFVSTNHQDYFISKSMLPRLKDILLDSLGYPWLRNNFYRWIDSYDFSYVLERRYNRGSQTEFEDFFLFLII